MHPIFVAISIDQVFGNPILTVYSNFSHYNHYQPAVTRSNYFSVTPWGKYCSTAFTTKEVSSIITGTCQRHAQQGLYINQSGATDPLSPPRSTSLASNIPENIEEDLDDRGGGGGII